MVLAAFIISFVALGVAVLTLPTVAQMFWGRPRITLDYMVSETQNTRILTCQINNLPITKGFLYKIGVRTETAESIYAGFVIHEYGNERVVFTGAIPPIISWTTEQSERVNLPASHIPAVFGVIGVNYQSNIISPYDKDTQIILAPGKYNARIVVYMGGGRIHGDHNFVVTENHPFAYWL